jgi:hypothetical protein
MENLTMDELVARHNEAATAKGLPTAESFKSLKAAREAVAKIEAVAIPEPNAEAALVVVTSGAVERGPVQGVGAFAKAQILAGKNNKDALAATLQQFPTAKTSLACIAYYRTKLVKEGKITTARAQAAAASETPAEAATETEVEAAA